MKGAHLLITGGAGCLGANIAAWATSCGARVLAIDNFATGSPKSLEGMAGVELLEGSITNSALVEKAFAQFRPDYVIHAAAAYKDPSNWLEDISTNTCGTAIIIRACEDHGAKRLIYFQTALCYGIPRQIPIPVSEPLNPITSYGISKTAGENLLKLCKTPCASLRLANIVAPGLAIGPIPTFYKRLKEGKACFCTESVRDFLDIDDFLALLSMCLRNDAPTGIFNVSTGQGHSMRQVYDVVAQYLDIDAPEPPSAPCGADDIPAVVLDPRLTEQEFGWRAKISFAAMLAKMLKWYDQHGISNIYSHLAHNAPDTENG